MSVPFRFRLERVRALRERKEELARVELAEAMSRLTDSEDRMRAADERLAQAREDHRSAAGTGATSGADMRASQAYLERIEQQRSRGAQEMRRSRSEVDDRNVLLGRARQEHEMLERLKERQRGEHLREIARREVKALDELAIERFRRSAAC